MHWRHWTCYNVSIHSMSQPYLSIIIPAYNEAERIPQALLAMDKQLANASYSYEIFVVNDGSTDNTAEIVKNMVKLVRNLKLIDLRVNAGKGGAVRQGMLLSAGQVRLFTDADNFLISFHETAMNTTQRFVVLATAILMDLLFFETQAERK